MDLGADKTTLIIGTNGAGKSTILDAIVFALYGKPFRKVTKTQLINSINKKDAMVEIEFSINKNSYMVRRGIKPNIFEIWKDGVLVDQNSTTAEYQEHLEVNILKLNYKSFGQIVILGSATYVPFMQLTTPNRREVIEDLLDIQIFSTMNILLKKRISENKEDIINKTHGIELVQAKLSSAQENNKSITSIKQIQVDDIKEKVAKQLEVIEYEKGSIEKLLSDIDTHLGSISDKKKISERLDKMKSLVRDLENKKVQLTKDIGFYHDHDSCPTCMQGIEHSFKEKIVDEKKTTQVGYSDGVKTLNSKIEETVQRSTEISGVESQIQKMNVSVGEHRGNIRMSTTTLMSYKKDLEHAEKDVSAVDESQILEYQNDISVKHKDQEVLYGERETLSVVSAMLKDGGIKTRIIKQYIPVMNKLLNKYLAEFELFVDFQLDENFNEVIKSRHRDAFSYTSFSEGEKMRINLAILLTWRTVSKMRNSVTTNILIFDEIFDGALDDMGVSNLIKVLQHLTSGDNVYVISHKGDALADHFDSTIRFEKHKNFSQMEKS